MRPIWVWWARGCLQLLSSACWDFVGGKHSTYTLNKCPVCWTPLCCFDMLTGFFFLLESHSGFWWWMVLCFFFYFFNANGWVTTMSLKVWEEVLSLQGNDRNTTDVFVRCVPPVASGIQQNYLLTSNNQTHFYYSNTVLWNNSAYQPYVGHFWGVKKDWIM